VQATPVFVVFVCTDSTPNVQKNELNVKIDRSSPLRMNNVIIKEYFLG